MTDKPEIPKIPAIPKGLFPNLGNKQNIVVISIGQGKIASKDPRVQVIARE